MKSANCTVAEIYSAASEYQFAKLEIYKKLETSVNLCHILITYIVVYRPKNGAIK